jgi:hypothetical protein
MEAYPPQPGQLKCLNEILCNISGFYHIAVVVNADIFVKLIDISFPERIPIFLNGFLTSFQQLAYAFHKRHRPPAGWVLTPVLI